MDKVWLWQVSQFPQFSTNSQETHIRIHFSTKVIRRTSGRNLGNLKPSSTRYGTRNRGKKNLYVASLLIFIESVPTSLTFSTARTHRMIVLGSVNGLVFIVEHDRDRLHDLRLEGTELFWQVPCAFLVSLCLKANAEMVPKIPSCHYMLLM